jgi:hypothetical protein
MYVWNDSVPATRKSGMFVVKKYNQVLKTYCADEADAYLGDAVGKTKCQLDWFLEQGYTNSHSWCWEIIRGALNKGCIPK